MQGTAGMETSGGVKRGVGRASRAIHAGLTLALLLAINGIAAGQSQSPSGSMGGQSGSMGGVSGAQNSGSTRTGFGHTGFGSLSNDDDGFDPVMAERRIRALNAERQKQMVSDANKLLKLARELNDEVASANSGAFTPDQLRKIGEIEKLARSVRERMTSGVGESNIAPAPGLVYPVH
jgi:hypothetical protein